MKFTTEKSKKAKKKDNITVKTTQNTIVRTFVVLFAIVCASCAYNDFSEGPVPSNEILPYKSMEDLDAAAASAKRAVVLNDDGTKAKDQFVEEAPGTIQIWPPPVEAGPDELYGNFLADKEPVFQDGEGLLPAPPADQVIDPIAEAAAQEAADKAELDRLAMQVKYEEELALVRERLRQAVQANNALQFERDRADREAEAAKAELAKNPNAAAIAELAEKLKKAEEEKATIMSGLADQERMNDDMRTLQKQLDEKSARITQLYNELQALKQQDREGAGAPQSSTTSPTTSSGEVVSLFFNPSYVEPFTVVPKEVKVGHFETSASMRRFKSLGVVTPEGFAEGVLHLRSGPLTVSKWELAGNSKPVNLLLEELTGGAAGASFFVLYFEPKGEIVSGGSLLIKTLPAEMKDGGDITTAHNVVEWPLLREKQSLMAILDSSSLENGVSGSDPLPRIIAITMAGGLLSLLLFGICYDIRRRYDRVPSGPADPEDNSSVRSRSPGVKPAADSSSTNHHRRRPIIPPARKSSGGVGGPSGTSCFEHLRTMEGFGGHEGVPRPNRRRRQKWLWGR